VAHTSLAIRHGMPSRCGGLMLRMLRATASFATSNSLLAPRGPSSSPSLLHPFPFFVKSTSRGVLNSPIQSAPYRWRFPEAWVSAKTRPVAGSNVLWLRIIFDE